MEPSKDSSLWWVDLRVDARSLTRDHDELPFSCSDTIQVGTLVTAVKDTGFVRVRVRSAW